MKYLIIGAGATGGCIGGFLAHSGKDVTFIARGKHLEAIEQRGLFILSPNMGKIHIKEPKAMKSIHYEDKADVIFVCVKYYSVDELIPFIEKASHENTIIIPISNVFGVATKIAYSVPKVISLGGCIYIASDISNYGEITQRSDIFRMIYGFKRKEDKSRNSDEIRAAIQQITDDLIESGIDASVSENIGTEVYRKFSFVSPMSAAGAYLNANAGDMQIAGKARDIFIELTKEVAAVGKTMYPNLGDDLVEKNLEILSGLLPNMTSSMQKDLEKGGDSEMEGLVFNVVKMARRNNVSVPMYEKISAEFGYKK